MIRSKQWLPQAGVVGINSYPLFIAETKQQQNLHHLADILCIWLIWQALRRVGLGFDILIIGIPLPMQSFCRICINTARYPGFWNC